MSAFGIIRLSKYILNQKFITFNLDYIFQKFSIFQVITLNIAKIYNLSMY